MTTLFSSMDLSGIHLPGEEEEDEEEETEEEEEEEEEQQVKEIEVIDLT